jgi:hypothetical protein
MAKNNTLALIHYAPGLIGLALMLRLTIVAKITYSRK